ncbi:MAG: cobalamin-binding protein [Gammaproteobacteria bacterium]|jgi:methanogenic corrinoid protein MtbC1|nr:cobalamin-binding protein [Gammaproteobacteria bacterium]MBT3726065.1 cobalamin-binding protein [Gammaproteobacteria bacterium]MBT4077676.1 cobalamin-binding protein [Gammaproteobacteria bacterium]MBT4193088.1 cobalamin-binding protein [Gammaproteobacteria bacterium]MBT4451700.1 cobalamin-binding protein [Gammaproteobacteria bacterium]
MTKVKERIQLFQDALSSLDKVKADKIFDEALKDDPPIVVVEQIVVPALENIGQAWQEGALALSQIYMSGRFCEEMVERVLPPSDPDRKRQPRSAIVVLNDYHMLGKRIVYSVMRASGFELFDYGRMDVEELVKRIRTDNLRVLMISVLMLPSALQIRQLREALDTAGINIKILVGGAPFLFDSELWRDVGADAMGKSASDAIQIIETWMEEMT